MLNGVEKETTSSSSTKHMPKTYIGTRTSRINTREGNNMSLQSLAREINMSFAPNPMPVVGRRIKHPDGRTVKIISGYYLDPIFGRVSNLWTWRPVMKNGKLGRAESGYR